MFKILMHLTYIYFGRIILLTMGDHCLFNERKAKMQVLNEEFVQTTSYVMNKDGSVRERGPRNGCVPTNTAEGGSFLDMIHRIESEIQAGTRKPFCDTFVD